jgi:hypothetical protein
MWESLLCRAAVSLLRFGLCRLRFLHVLRGPRSITLGGGKSEVCSLTSLEGRSPRSIRGGLCPLDRFQRGGGGNLDLVGCFLRVSRRDKRQLGNPLRRMRRRGVPSCRPPVRK